MVIYRVRRKIHWEDRFSSAHFLTLPYKSPCQRIHGHEYKVEIEIEGELNDDGMILDFTKLKEIVKELDHKIIIPKSRIVDEAGKVIDIVTDTGSDATLNAGEYVVINGNATAENIAEYIALKIIELGDYEFDKVIVRVWEDERSYAEVVFEK